MHRSEVMFKSTGTLTGACTIKVKVCPSLEAANCLEIPREEQDLRSPSALIC